MVQVTAKWVAFFWAIVDVVNRLIVYLLAPQERKENTRLISLNIFNVTWRRVLPALSWDSRPSSILSCEHGEKASENTRKRDNRIGARPITNQHDHTGNRGQKEIRRKRERERDCLRLNIIKIDNNKNGLSSLPLLLFYCSMYTSIGRQRKRQWKQQRIKRKNYHRECASLMKKENRQT
jgi:hypothetical protein